MPSSAPVPRELFEAERSLRAAAVALDKAVDDADRLSRVESETLEIVRRTGPLPGHDLVRATGLASSTVYEIVDRLVRKGVARRVQRPEVSWIPLIDLEPGYRARSEKFSKRADAAVLELCDQYDPGQLDLLIGFVAAVTQLRRAAANELRGAPSHRRRAGEG